MRSFFDPICLTGLWRSQDRFHHSSSLFHPGTVKCFAAGNNHLKSCYLTYLSHFRNLDGATQVYYKDFSSFFTCIFNTGNSLLNDALHKVSLSLTLTKVKFCIWMYSTSNNNYHVFFLHSTIALSYKNTVHGLLFFKSIKFNSSLKICSPISKTYL